MGAQGAEEADQDDLGFLPLGFSLPPPNHQPLDPPTPPPSVSHDSSAYQKTPHSSKLTISIFPPCPRTDLTLPWTHLSPTLHACFSLPHIIHTLYHQPLYPPTSHTLRFDFSHLRERTSTPTFRTWPVLFSNLSPLVCFGPQFPHRYIPLLPCSHYGRNLRTIE